MLGHVSSTLLASSRLSPLCRSANQLLPSPLPDFVLAVNIRYIDWGKLIKATHKDVAARNSRWTAMQNRKAKESEKANKGEPATEQSEFQKKFQLLCHFTRMTKFDMIAQVLAWLYYCHWIIYFPVCSFYYYTFFGSTIRSFIISSVTDGTLILSFCIWIH